MVQEFKTTFIPQAPKIATPPPASEIASRTVRTRRTVSILTVLASLFLFAGGIACGGVYIYAQSFDARIADMTANLERSEGQFEARFIRDVKELDERLDLSLEVLRRHRSMAPFFRLLNDLTLKTIQYDSFSFEMDETGKSIATVEGQARSYQALAQQSEIFEGQDLIQDVSFSDFVLQDTGRVQFGLVLTLSPDLVIFENSIRTLPSQDILSVLPENIDRPVEDVSLEFSR